MIDDPTCPVCSLSCWREIGSRRYSRPAESKGSHYVNQRLGVLFDVWLPGQSSVEVRAVLCEACGMVIQRPRPEAADLDAKYHYLRDRQAAVPASAMGSARVVASANSVERGAEMQRAISRLAGRRIRDLNVLDYGGGDGQLMQPFLQANCHCELVDYAPHQLAGVRKIGDTLASVPADRRYDLVIASHVVEHLADPLAVVASLAERLAPGGLLYVEVPMEIWGQPPLQAEPVTHINFFSRSSLRCLLEAAGLQVLDCQLASSRHPTGRRFAAVKAVATQGSPGARPPLPGPAEVERLLSPHPLRRLQAAASSPRVVVSALRHRLRSALAGGRQPMGVPLP